MVSAENPLEEPLLLREVPGRELEQRTIGQGSVPAGNVLVDGEGEVLEHIHGGAHPWKDETWSEMVGEAPTTRVAELAAADAAASCAPATPEEERNNEQA